MSLRIRPGLALRLACLLLACPLLIWLLPGRAEAQSIELFLGPTYADAESLGAFDMGILATTDDPEVPEIVLGLVLPLEIRRGYGVAPTVTVRSGRWFGHEVGYNYSRADLVFDFRRANYVASIGDDLPPISGSISSDPVVQRIVVRELGYGLVFTPRPRAARLQPYVLAGPRLVAYRFANAGGGNSSFFRRIGLGTVGSVVGGIRAGRRSPLDGGAIYRWGIGYGGGLGINLTRTLGLKVDIRQTVIANPDFATAEAEELLPAATTVIAQEATTIRRFHLTVGATFRF